MVVRVRLFAVLRELAGSSSLELTLPEGATVDDALAALKGQAELAAGVGKMSLVMAVNRDYAPGSRVLQAGDELALIPPVSGGEAGQPVPTHVRITAEPLSLEAVAKLVGDPGAGAVVTFQGTTRNVESLYYEAYEEMAAERIAAILGAAVERHGLLGAAAEHRTGEVPLAEPSVIVACSAAHRAEAFAGAREVIDRIKAEAPIWKKEVGASGGGTNWVAGRPPSAGQG